MKPHTFEVKAYNLKELAAIYEVDRKTFGKWLEPHQNAIGKKQGKLYTPLQVKIIIEKLGLPSQYDE